MKKIFIILLFSQLFCSSAQVIKSVTNDEVKHEKKRTKTVIDYIKNSCLDDFGKTYLISEFESKDMTIARQAKIILAYQNEATKEKEKCENKQDEFIKDQKDCLIDAGYGRSFKMIFYGLIGIFVLFLVYVAMKKGLFGLIKGS